MSMSIIRIEVARMLRNRGFLKFLVFLCFVAFLSVPGKEDRYAVILINEMTSVKNTYWLTTVPIVIANMIYVMVGFYFFRGSLNSDRLSGLFKEIHVTGIDREKYLRLRFYALLIVQFILMAALVVIVFLLHLLKSNGDLLDLRYLVTMFLYIQLPTYFVMASVVLIFEMHEMLRTKAGDLIYFFVSLVILMMTISNPWIDLTGVSDTIQSIRTQLNVTSQDVQVFTNLRPVIEYSYQGLEVIIFKWIGKALLNCLSILGFLAMAKHYCKSDFYRSDPLESTSLENRLKESVRDSLEPLSLEQWQHSVKCSQSEFAMTRTPIATGLVTVIKQEWLLLIKNHRIACFFHLLFVGLALLIREPNTSSLLLKIGFLLLLPICTEIAQKTDPGIVYDLMRTTSFGNRYRSLQFAMLFLALLPTAAAFNILSLKEDHLWSLALIFLSTLTYSGLLYFYNAFMRKMFDLLFLLTWFISIFQETMWVDWLYISRDTDIWFQSKISMFIIALMGIILLIFNLLTSIKTILPTNNQPNYKGEK